MSEALDSLTPLQLKTLILLASEGPQTTRTSHEADPLVKPAKWLVHLGLAERTDLPPVHVRGRLWRRPLLFSITAKGRAYFAEQAERFRRLSLPSEQYGLAGEEGSGGSENE